MQVLLDSVNNSVGTFGGCFEPWKCKMQDWIDSNSNLVFAGEQLGEGSWTSLDSPMPEKVPWRMQKVRLTLPNLRHLWRWHDFQLSTKS